MGVVDGVGAFFTGSLGILNSYRELTGAQCQTNLPLGLAGSSSQEM